MICSRGFLSLVKAPGKKDRAKRNEQKVEWDPEADPGEEQSRKRTIQKVEQIGEFLV